MSTNLNQPPGSHGLRKVLFLWGFPKSPKFTAWLRAKIPARRPNIYPLRLAKPRVNFERSVPPQWRSLMASYGCWLWWVMSIHWGIAPTEKMLSIVIYYTEQEKTSWTIAEEFKLYVNVMYYIIFVWKNWLLASPYYRLSKPMGCCLFDSFVLYRWYGRWLIHFWPRQTSRDYTRWTQQPAYKWRWNHPCKEDFFRLFIRGIKGL